MANEDTRGYPYPGPDDDPDVPYWMQRLAEELGVDVQSIADRVGANEKAARGILKRATNGAARSTSDANWIPCDIVAVPLVKDRWYEATIVINSLCMGAANVALAAAVRASPTTDVTAAGNEVEGSATLWTAPASGSGKFHQVSFIWKAASTETLNLKLVMCRAVGTGLVDLQNRRLTVRDLGANL